MQRLDGGLGLAGVRHLHKRKTPRPARLAIGGDLGSIYAAIAPEEFLEVKFAGGKGDVPDENPHGASPPGQSSVDGSDALYRPRPTRCTSRYWSMPVRVSDRFLSTSRCCCIS